MRRPVQARRILGRHLSTVKRLGRDNLFARLTPRLGRVNSIRQVLTHLTLQSTHPESLTHLHGTLRRLPRLTRDAGRFRRTRLLRLTSLTRPVSSVYRLLRHTIGRGPPIIVHSNNILTSNCGRRLVCLKRRCACGRCLGSPRILVASGSVALFFSCLFLC